MSANTRHELDHQPVADQLVTVEHQQEFDLLQRESEELQGEDLLKGHYESTHNKGEHNH